MIEGLRQKLAEPFDLEDIEVRAGATNGDNTQCMALAYTTSRAVMDRLDNVVGPENWRDEYKEGPQGGVLCGISLFCGENWVTKWDGAENTQYEAVKGGLSDAFKRAAVKWGIGRYLYNLPNTWVKARVTQRGNKTQVYIENEDAAKHQMFGKKPPTQGPRNQDKVKDWRPNHVEFIKAMASKLPKLLRDTSSEAEHWVLVKVLLEQKFNGLKNGWDPKSATKMQAYLLKLEAQVDVAKSAATE